MKNSAETQSSAPRARRQPKGNGTKTEAASRDPEDVREGSRDSNEDPIAETSRHLVEDANVMAESMTDAATQINIYLREQATQRPYVALGAAAGIGFVLGGGLSLRLTTTLLSIGGRLLVTQLWQQAAQRATAH
jgi:ElaB/YqjD/DUF883 family membrane-anchored ribosome-binding protein